MCTAFLEKENKKFVEVSGLTKKEDYGSSWAQKFNVKL